MKRCPVCKSVCFDDMSICYGCMHSFDNAVTTEKTPLQKIEEAMVDSGIVPDGVKSSEQKNAGVFLDEKQQDNTMVQKENCVKEKAEPIQLIVPSISQSSLGQQSAACTPSVEILAGNVEVDQKEEACSIAETWVVHIGVPKGVNKLSFTMQRT